MIYTHHTVSSRPLKIAFLIEYEDKINLEKALTINSILWGNNYNPFIPVYKRIPSKYKGISGYKDNKKHAITLGYIDAYDPDFIINLSSFPNEAFNLNKARFITEDDIFKDAVKSRRRHYAQINYGVGIFELLDYLREREFKYVRKVPLNIADVTVASRNKLFLGSVFGLIPDKARDDYMKRYKSTIDIKTKHVSLSNFFDVWNDGDAQLSGVCNSYFSVFDGNGPNRSYIFLMDVNSWQDIIDFQCLRASGLDVLPIPIQLSKTAEAIRISKSFIESRFRKYNDNGVYYTTNILKSRDCDEKVFEEFAKSIAVEPKEGTHFMASQQSWFPRIWESFGRYSDCAMAPKLEHSTKSQDITGTMEINIPQLIPRVLGHDPDFWHKPKYANDISSQAYGEDDFMANVFPTNIDRVDMVLGHYDPGEWRFSKSGLAFTPTSPDAKITFNLPTAEKVYQAWLESKGIKSSMSNPGKIAQQIVKKLGVDHINLLAFEDFAQLLQKLTDDKGRVNSVPAQAIKGAIHKFTKDTIWYSADGFMKWVLHTGIFELGAEVTCDNCGSTSWQSLKSLDSEISCNVCYETINVGSSGNPEKDIKWAYRPKGPFAVPKLGDGSYTVVLALNFFKEVLHLKITPKYSFASKNGEFEADFGVLVSPNWLDGNSILNLVGEAKSFGNGKKPQFATSDVKKLEMLAGKNDNSVIVFATLARKLHPKDKNMLKKLAIKLRNARLKQSSPPDLLILTGNELFTHRNLEDSYSKLSVKHKSFVASQRSNYYRIPEMSDITQQLYLDMESLSDFQTRVFNIHREVSAVSIKPKKP